MNPPAPAPQAAALFDHTVDRVAPSAVWGLCVVMSLAATASSLHAFPNDWLGAAANAALPASGTVALILAVRKVRARTRFADAFYPLVLLNPLLFSRAAGPSDPTLLSAGLLALMAGAIIAMKHDRYLRYLAVALLAAALARLSEMFILLLPAIVAWLIYSGYAMARSAESLARKRGIAVMAAAEIGLVFFGLACILIDPTTTPLPSTLFSTNTGLMEFLLLVLAIVMLALGWRRGPAGKTPPYFSGMLALLLALLGMLLNNFQAGMLPAPGADQTALILCLFYTVTALHGPRRFQWLIPPLLLVAAVMHTLFRA